MGPPSFDPSKSSTGKSVRQDESRQDGRPNPQSQGNLSKKEEEKKQKEAEEKKRHEEQKKAKDEEKKKHQQEEQRKKEEEKKKHQEDDKRKKEEEKKHKDDDKKRKQEEDKRKKEEEKKKHQDDEKRKKDEEKKHKEDDKKKHQDEEKRKKEDEKKHKDQDKKQKKEDEKRQADEKKKAQKDEKQKAEMDKKKKKEDEERRKIEEQTEEAKKKGKGRTCRAGVCRCWYCCCAHCCLLPILWLYGLALFAFSLYYALKYTLEVDKEQQQLGPHLLYWTTVAYASILIVLVQLTYILVMFESIHPCGKCMFAFMFILTFLLCLAVLVYSIYCYEFCPYGKFERYPVLKDIEWRQKIPIQLFHLRFAAAITMGLMVFLLHIYLYNALQFTEEVALKENKEQYCGKTESDAASNATTIKSTTTNATSSLSRYRTESEITNNNNNNYYYNCGSSFVEIAHRYRSISAERTPRSNYNAYQSNYSSPVSIHSSYSYYSNKSFQC